MILFSSNKVERMIADNAFNSWEKAKYLILTTAFYSINGAVYVISPSFEPKNSPMDSLISMTVYILIAIWGVKICYQSNKNIDDHRFIERFTILNVPMTIKFIIICLPIIFLIAYFPYFITEDTEIRKQIAYYSIRTAGPIGMIIYYMFLNRSFMSLKTKMKT